MSDLARDATAAGVSVETVSASVLESTQGAAHVPAHLPTFAAVLTRPAGQSTALVAQVAAVATSGTTGAPDITTVEFPLIDIQPVDDTAPLLAALRDMASVDLVFFVSPNAVDHAFACAGAYGLPLQETLRKTAQSGALIAAVGPGTVQALARHGVGTDSHRLVMPDGALPVAFAADAGQPTQAHDVLRFDSEALLVALDRQVPRADWAGRRVVIIRGDGGRELFGDALRAAGARVTAVMAYHRRAPVPSEQAWASMEQLLDHDIPHVWVLTSSEAVRTLRQLADARFGAANIRRPAGNDQAGAAAEEIDERDEIDESDPVRTDDPGRRRLRTLLHTPVLVPHPRIAAAAAAAGFDTISHTGAGDRNLALGILAAHQRMTRKQTTDRMADDRTDDKTGSVPNQPGTQSRAEARAEADRQTASPAGTRDPARGGRIFGRGSADNANRTAAAPRHGASRAATGALWAVLILTIAGAAGGGIWLERHFSAALEQADARQRAGTATLADVQRQSDQSAQITRQLNQQLTDLNGKVANTQTQQQALQQMYQDLARNRDDWIMTQAERTVSSANQQLQLTGDVPMALAALQSADSALATSSAPQVLDVRRALASDMTKLKAVPVIDVPGLALQLDQAIAQVNALPLSGDVAPNDRNASKPLSGLTSTDAGQAGSADNVNPASPAGETVIKPWYRGGLLQAAYWRRVWLRLTQGAGDTASQWVQVRRIDRESAADMLLPPRQDAYLRENLTLRLLSARLSLLARNEGTLQIDLAAADDVLARYFDPSSNAVTQVRDTIAAVRRAAQHVTVPTLDDSLQALHQTMTRG